MRSRIVPLLLLLLAAPAPGLEPYLVEDINPIPQPATSFPSFFASLGGVARSLQRSG